MRNPDLVLDNLATHSEQTGYRYDKVYRNLYNLSFFQKAARSLPGVAPVAKEKLEQLVEDLKRESYRPPRFTEGRKRKSHPFRPQVQPAAEPFLIEEIAALLLGAMFEGSISACPGRHPDISSAIRSIKADFRGAKWWISASLEKLSDGLDTEKAIAILRRRIADEKFLRLIRKYLKAGYFRRAVRRDPSRTLANGFSRLIADIMLSELDHFMNRLVREADSSASIRYVRSGTQILVGVDGPKIFAAETARQMAEYAEEAFGLKNAAEMLKLTHWKKGARFAGYEILPAGGAEKAINLSLPHDELLKFMLQNGYIKLEEGRWKAMHRPGLLYLPDEEILRIYNAEFKRLARYYREASNRNEKLAGAYFMFAWSFKKTLAGKYRTKVKKLLGMKTSNGKKRFFREGAWGVSFINARGKEDFALLVTKEELRRL